MKTTLTAMVALLVSCLLLTGCDLDDEVLKIRIDTPTTEASFSTTAAELIIGGTVTFPGSAGSYGYRGEVHATNLRTGRRYEANLSDSSKDCRWHVLIPDLQPGDNEIVATALSANDHREARITIVRTQ